MPLVPLAYCERARCTQLCEETLSLAVADNCCLIHVQQPASDAAEEAITGCLWPRAGEE